MMKILYELKPVDTLFFRGSEPMEAGQLSTSVLFPPPSSVLIGAIRTALLRKWGVSFSDYNNSHVSPDLIEKVGQSGKEAPFSLQALFIKKDNELYAPSPYSYFIDTEKKIKKGSDYAGLTILYANPLNKESQTALGIKSSANVLPIVLAEHEAQSLGGTWMRLSALCEGKKTIGGSDILLASEIYSIENRTGISLLDSENRPSRKVKEGALFSGAHIRLHEGISFVFALDKDPGLNELNFLQLGGERRKVAISPLEIPIPPIQKDGLFSSLIPIQADKNSKDASFCTGRLYSLAGWDLAKGFHKPTRNFYPAGSVFKINVDGNCLAIHQ